MKITAAAASGSVLSCNREQSQWRFFTNAEAKTVTAMTERIIPADQDPGASWAGVVVFIDRQLKGFHKKYQKSYRAGLAAVEQTSHQLHGKGFADLSAAEQAALLTLLEKGKAPAEIWKDIPAPPFFAMIVDHTMQGFYGSPRHGGNRDGVSYRMLGMPNPPLRGRQHYDFPETT